jgi:hypothetical protein
VPSSHSVHYLIPEWRPVEVSKLERVEHDDGVEWVEGRRNGTGHLQRTMSHLSIEKPINII